MRKAIFAVMVIAFMHIPFTLFSQVKKMHDESEFTRKPEIDMIKINLNLNIVKDDMIMVSIVTPRFKQDTIEFNLPKVIPGTYTECNYGREIKNFIAYDRSGYPLASRKRGHNTWVIPKARTLSKVIYWVNDTFDDESKYGVFSPWGSNIEYNKNFLLNMHGFIGYFTDFRTLPHRLEIAHPESLVAASALPDLVPSSTVDVFKTTAYDELIDNPILYGKTNSSTFVVGGTEFKLCVYSPNNIFTADKIVPQFKQMLNAQKNYLKRFNLPKKYSILLYLSDPIKSDARGYGALEHKESALVIMSEGLVLDELVEQMKDIVSHEIFHNITPLAVHSVEIQDFDYLDPKMSQHLWLYEGATEYLANLFQVNQGLIKEEEFYERMATKMRNSNRFNDTIPFTTISKSVLVKPHKEEFLNVFEKGALIGMCLDIQIRESSKGKKGLLDVLHRLSELYTPSKPFEDDALFGKITELTYPEIGEFFSKYVAGENAIPYDYYLEKMGVTKTPARIPENVFLNGEIPYITLNTETKEIIVIPDSALNLFMISLGLRGGDIITEVNGKVYNLDNVYDLLKSSEKWGENDPIVVKYKRDGKIQTINGKVRLTFVDTKGFKFSEPSKKLLKDSWLKG